MSKHNMKLTLVEMYAIKHGLEKALPRKRMQLAGTLLALIVVAPVISVAISNITQGFKDGDKKLEHPERLTLKGDK